MSNSAHSSPRVKLPHEEPVLSFHPSWKGMLGWHIKRGALALLVCAAAFVAQNAGAIAIYWFVLTVLVSFGAVYGCGRVIRQATTYRITTRRVSETKGILTKKTESAFFSDISNTTVEQSLMERMLGCGHLDFDTAGERNITRELQHRDPKNTSFLAWWGVPRPRHVESLVDGLRFGDDEPDERSDDESDYQDISDS